MIFCAGSFSCDGPACWRRCKERGHILRDRSYRVQKQKWTYRDTPSLACPYRKSNPDVLMMQSAEDRQSLNEPGGLDSPSARRVFGQRQVRADAIVVVGVTAEHMTKVPLAEHDDVVKAFPAERSDQALRVAILP